MGYFCDGCKARMSERNMYKFHLSIVCDLDSSDTSSYLVSQTQHFCSHLCTVAFLKYFLEERLIKKTGKMKDAYLKIDCTEEEDE